MSKGLITCHVLDVSIGKPAEGIEVNLQVYHDNNHIGVFNPLSQGVTDSNGRCMTLFPPRGSEETKQTCKEITTGTYKIVFKPEEYFAKSGRKCFYPWVEIPFRIENPQEHYHIPLLISPYSFTTYRGS
ncbi:transthyretin [Gyrodon lividus]|nr:transthyretin [Gyrodon lividus]